MAEDGLGEGVGSSVDVDVVLRLDSDFEEDFVGEVSVGIEVPVGIGVPVVEEPVGIEEPVGSQMPGFVGELENLVEVPC